MTGEKKDQAVAEVGATLAQALAQRGHPLNARSEEPVEAALREAYDRGRRDAHGCISAACTNPGYDYATLTLSTPSGAMKAEVLLCEFDMATLEMFNHGKYMLLRRKP